MHHAKDRHAKANNKYMKDYDPSKQSSYLNNLSVGCQQLVQMGNITNVGYRWFQMVKITLAIDGFKWKKYLLRFDEGLIQNYDEDTGKGCILQIDAK